MASVQRASVPTFHFSLQLIIDTWRSGSYKVTGMFLDDVEVSTKLS